MLILKMSARLPLHTAAMLLVLGLIASAGPHPAPPEELPAAIAWFNGLTIPDVAGKPYVEVVCQRYPTTGGKLYEEKHRGFLIAEDEKTWTIVPDGTAPPGRRDFSPARAGGSQSVHRDELRRRHCPSWQARVCDHAAGALLSMRRGKWIGPGEASIAARDALITQLKATAPQNPGDAKK